MVNRALQGYLIDMVGSEQWESICESAQVPTTYHDSMTYDDDHTYAIVGAASAVLECSAEDILIGFGRHWVQFTGREGWGPVFDMAGSDLRTFVEGLDELHARVQSAMPDSVMPSFGVSERDDGSLQVAYRSGRQGLEPMVVGLLDGLVDHFGETWTVERAGAEGTAALFVLRPG